MPCPCQVRVGLLVGQVLVEVNEVVVVVEIVNKHGPRRAQLRVLLDGIAHAGRLR